MRPSTLWKTGACLVALGIAAHLLGWDAILWFPRLVIDWLAWGPAAIVEAVEASPSTAGLVVLGIALMVIAKLWMRQKD